MIDFKLVNQLNTYITKSDAPNLKEFKKKYSHNDLTDDSLKVIKNTIESALTSQVKDHSFLQYSIMESLDEWGDGGEMQVKQAFAQICLNKSLRDYITTQDFEEVSNIVKKHLKQSGFGDLSIEEKKQKINHFPMHFLKINYTIHDVDRINKWLVFLKSKWVLQGGVYGTTIEAILGVGVFYKMGDYNVTCLTKEIARTPNIIHAMAAVIGNRSIFIRNTALKFIYQQKWGGALREKDFFVYEPAHKVSALVKKRVLDLYKITNHQQLIKYETRFIKDASETILYHELGHGIIQHHLLPKELATLGEATKLYGENIFTGLLELLAEVAPKYHALNGPLYQITQVAKQDPKRAVCMYWMYVSDTWFFDTSDEYMYDYSDLMAYVMLQYINADKSINFEQLETDLNIENSQSFIKNVLKITEEGLANLKIHLEKATYIYNQDSINFETIKEHVRQELEVQFQHQQEEDDYSKEVSVWLKIVEYSQKSVVNADIKNTIKIYKSKVITMLTSFFDDKANVSSIETYRKHLNESYLKKLS